MESSYRVHFLDNLRYLTAIGVVILHTSLGYSTWIDWWVVNDPNPKDIFNYILILTDIIVMPMFFFLAGFFAMPSYKQYGPKTFIKKKLKRLALPWLFGMLVLTPILSYIYNLNYFAYYVDDYFYYLFVQNQHSFLEAWMKFWSNSFYISPLSQGFIRSQGWYSQYHYWFLSELLIFFLVFVFINIIINKIRNKKLQTDPQENSVNRRRILNFSKESSKISIIFSLILLAIITTVCYSLTVLILNSINVLPQLNRETWVRIAPIIHFRPARLPIYICFFCCGIYAYKKKWFAKERGVRGGYIWALITLILFFVFMDIVYKGWAYSTQLDQRLQYDIVRIILTVSFLGTLLSLSFKSWNKTTKFSTLMSQNSYHIYLVHYPILALLQFLFVQAFKIDPMIKFIIIVLVTTFSSVIIGEFLIRRKILYYYLSLIGLFIILIFVLQ